MNDKLQEAAPSEPCPRCEKLEQALAAWEKTSTPCKRDRGGYAFCTAHNALWPCPHSEARRLTAEARK